jgi:hypothetical protein
MAMRRREDDEVYPNAAGIDVGGSSHWVAVPRSAADQPVREFGATTCNLHAMADWLLACGVDTVALDSTGVSWIPVYEVLEQRGLSVATVMTILSEIGPDLSCFASVKHFCSWLRLCPAKKISGGKTLA